MKYLFFIVAFACCDLLAENVTSSDGKDALKQKLAHLTTYSATFSQTVIDLQGELVQQATGKLILKQPSKLHWQVDEPNENTLVADGKTLWHVDPFVEQVIAMTQSSAIANNPIVLVTDPEHQQWAEFDVVQTSDTFVITAKSEQGQIEQLVLAFEEDTLTSLKIRDRQLQTSEFRFSDIQQNISVDPNLFTFTLPDGYELDDQRSQ